MKIRATKKGAKMKYLLLAFLLLPLSLRADETVVLERSVNAIYFFSNQGVGAQPHKWATVDVTALGLPVDTKAVFLQGLMAITGGTVPQHCLFYLLVSPNQQYDDFRNLIALRSPQNQSVIWPAFGIGEAVVMNGGAVRQPIATFVPVIDGKFFYLWTRSTSGEWPERCSYGANLVIQSYVVEGR